MRSFYRSMALALLVLAPLASQAQFGLLDAAVQRAADRVAARKIDEAVNRKVAEKTDEYYSRLLTEGRLVSYQVQFEPGTATLLPEAMPQLEALARILRDQPDLRLRIEAHTLLAGEAKANLALSQKRAEMVRSQLLKAGIAAARLQAKGLGETAPLATAPTDEDGTDALNQRVEFVKI